MRYIYSPEYVVDLGPHVFSTDKWAATAALLPGPFAAPAVPAQGDLRLVHAPQWVEKVLKAKLSPKDEMLAELRVTPRVSRAHQLQVSGTLMACRDALEEGVGLHVGGGSHHAFAGHAEGFCLLNDIAVAIKVLGRRAAVVDLDVHQGNGTAAIFKGDPSVFTFSMHQESLYPVPKAASSLDVGLPDGTGDREYLEKLEEGLDAVRRHKPQLIVYQAGVDCAQGDALGGLSLTAEGLRRRDELVRDTGLPVAVTLGGGYGAKAAALHAQTLLVFAAKR